jgi:S-methylmethionine-dependent homocysteine/selenocysteine methylase
MAKYRHKLPQISEQLFLTDGGMETTLVFHDGIDLPCFASFTLLDDEAGIARVARYYELYAKLATDNGLGFVLEAPTWRANKDWGAKLGYSQEALESVNRRAVALLAELRAKHETARSPMVISGNIGPRGDGYVVENAMSAQEAADYHGEQVRVFAGTEADMVSAFTMNYAEEAIGVANAAKKAGMPVVISFTLETDGRLPTGQTLKDAIEETDAATGQAPAYYMINCAHPTHFADALAAGEGWVKRIRGLRANASRRSHAELDQAKDLDIGDPVELGHLHGELRRKLPHLTVLGGCCGTDHRHVEEIRRSCAAGKAAA